ncbi:hypothetical protein FGG51_gp018 [Mycobacterium phage Astro]|uniref:Uncharacterized protein n=2 Tax=Fromanvirus astro TaxID=1195075 RepID=I6RA50_9CAUD|nr:hypothetical protein AVT31_gp019 [Mycobacterium phage Smeadley]YP_009638546.1 hypothetical protein FGG51_gp018 [Mycobacterium phage Astro]AXQ63593.1 hypothetical protein SEA_DIXON_87 [Mycobacterium phage Dixon]QBI96680.1 hypothetical protein SEA_EXPELLIARMUS_85 [Mycobacterium phage Expelliarmus]QHB36981.1 hypothetical protein SEA_ROARY_90 [Mycobacterium phage Roary]WNO26772.1 hypothetical protein SEA_GROUNDHOG_86 [Mycobacterium phage Groundhog]AFM54974.1 hypothetical protein ASTRO_88 [Myco
MIEISVTSGSPEDIATMLHDVAEGIRVGSIPLSVPYRTKLWAGPEQIGTIKNIPESAFD